MMSKCANIKMIADIIAPRVVTDRPSTAPGNADSTTSANTSLLITRYKKANTPYEQALVLKQLVSFLFFDERFSSVLRSCKLSDIRTVYIL